MAEGALVILLQFVEENLFTMPWIEPTILDLSSQSGASDHSAMEPPIYWQLQPNNLKG